MPRHKIHSYPTGRTDLDFLKKPLQSTFKYIDAYVERFSPRGPAEVPYKYSERTTVGLLAAGITKVANSFVLEEYPVLKRRSREGGNYKGRADLWFETDKTKCYAEAKQGIVCWPDAEGFTLDSANEIVNAVRQEAQQARYNASEEKDLEYAFGIVFVVPHIRTEDHTRAKNLMAQYHDFLDRAIADLCSENMYVVICGRYFRPDLLEPSRHYESDDKGPIARPALDVLICLDESTNG